ncbi:MAG: transcriptional repressor [Rickettsiales bacterium]|nr:transcriptional repressor [Rickettsiales bacterium]
MKQIKKTNDELVLDVIKKALAPVSAYEILAKLKNKIKSPPIIYRALARLEKSGNIHQIQATSTYTACHGNHNHQALNAMIICNKCGKIDEVAGVNFDEIILKAITKSALKIIPKSIEIIGLCNNCEA